MCGLNTLSTKIAVNIGGRNEAAVLRKVKAKPTKIIEARGLAKRVSRQSERLVYGAGAGAQLLQIIWPTNIDPPQDGQIDDESSVSSDLPAFNNFNLVASNAAELVFPAVNRHAWSRCFSPRSSRIPRPARSSFLISRISAMSHLSQAAKGSLGGVGGLAMTPRFVRHTIPLPNRNFASRLGSNQVITSSPGRSREPSSFFKAPGIAVGAFGVGECMVVAKAFTNGFGRSPWG